MNFIIMISFLSSIDIFKSAAIMNLQIPWPLLMGLHCAHLLNHAHLDPIKTTYAIVDYYYILSSFNILFSVIICCFLRCITHTLLRWEYQHTSQNDFKICPPLKEQRLTFLLLSCFFWWTVRWEWYYTSLKISKACGIHFLWHEVRTDCNESVKCEGSASAWTKCEV